MRRFEATEKTLDIIAITGTAFFSNPEAIHQIMERGVRIRVILLDHRPESLACLSVVRTCQKKSTREFC